MLNKLDLRSIMGCPGGHKHIIRSVFTNAFRGILFLKVFLEYDCNGEKIVVACLDVIMMSDPIW